MTMTAVAAPDGDSPDDCQSDRPCKPARFTFCYAHWHSFSPATRDEYIAKRRARRVAKPAAPVVERPKPAAPSVELVEHVVSTLVGDTPHECGCRPDDLFYCPEHFTALGRKGQFEIHEARRARQAAPVVAKPATPVVHKSSRYRCRMHFDIPVTPRGKGCALCARQSTQREAQRNDH
jgi:hypothetical protein